MCYGEIKQAFSTLHFLVKGDSGLLVCIRCSGKASLTSDLKKGKNVTPDDKCGKSISDRRKGSAKALR